MLPHIHSNECPVCGRDFGEVSDQPLTAHVSRVITGMLEQSGRLEAISKERVAAASLASSLDRELAAIRSRLLKVSARNVLSERISRLAELSGRLNELELQVRLGSDLMRVESNLSGAVATLRRSNETAKAVRDALDKIAKRLGQSTLADAEASEEALSRLSAHVASSSLNFASREEALTSIRNRVHKLVEIDTQIRRNDDDGQRERARLAAVHDAVMMASRERLVAKEIADAAVEARNVIVRRVFNESLNSLWRALFVRLAPNEVFVPGFTLPTGSGAVRAVLETVHRDGKKGGRPGSMLSSGNLNTAALTLFLALNLSVERELPFIVLDDPVQSMDEMHVAQFAALLRILSKQQDRQIIIAVHEESLFEYLALELSPSFEGDRLITVELGRNLSGESTAIPQYVHYERDPVGAAA